MIRRGLTYLLVIGFLAGVYAGAVLLGQEIFPEQPSYLIVLVATILVILLALVARPLRQVIQEGIDRLFYRETYAYRQALLSFSSRLGNIINLSELADEMLPTIGKALRITQAKLMFQQNGGGVFSTQFSYPK
ncbi:MAG: diguanylate cyclase, partial [Dehalococcoidales bacterium]|nr:diguanylate cyclase [Dehalococcoidales bacterium]